MRPDPLLRPFCRRFAALMLVLPLAGCLQLETHVRLHKDGSGTITERLRFSKRLLEFRGEGVPEKGLASLLGKKAILERMAHMGKGIKLVRHEVRDAERGAREAVSVFKIPKLTDFKYVSPYVGTAGYPKHHVIECREWPMYRNVWNGKRAGWMAVQFRVSGRHGKPSHKKASPADAQVYRHLQPIFQDMMKGLRLKFTFEGYGPVVVRRAGQRDRGTRPHSGHLIDFSWDDRDRSGRDFLSNEEVMIELLQMHLNGPNIRQNCGYSGSVPLFRFYAGAPEFMFRPSRYYFDKYFKGKTLDFGRGGKRTADPEKDVYRPSTVDRQKKQDKKKD